MTNSDSVYRILDAAADRGREAVRVLEDAVRFLNDDAAMTEQLKAFRHRYAAMTDLLPWEKRLAARETAGDVGAVIEGAGEYKRESLNRILSANFCRLQESLRSLEEYSKLAVPEMARQAEQLRYLSYTIHKKICGQNPGSERLRLLSAARFYVLIDTAVSDSDLAAIAGAGADIFQLRDKSASDRFLYETGKRFIALLSGLAERGEVSARPLFIVNDRADIALAIGADGVHIGQSELPPAEVRRIIGPDMLLGLSTSSVEEAAAAAKEITGSARVDCLGAGPVFPSKTKSFDQFPGLDYLSALNRMPASSVPVFAIGGITPENLSSVLDTGISRICVANAVTGQPDMGKAARELCALLPSAE